jgi:GMP synthase (glutamine-hydrolysing)
LEEGVGYKMILLINICKEVLHFSEFVKPVEDILAGEEVLVKHYDEVDENILKMADKVIICGTSLQDNDFNKDLEKFSWLRDFDKPVLGICGGFQLIGLVFGGKLKRKTEIGFYSEVFSKNFLGLENRQEVYHLHNYYVEFSKEFEVFCGDKIPQAVKHGQKELYGVLFHPEVRQKELIAKFSKT